MKIFLDTADVEEIRQGVAMGVVDGVTTNPSLAAKAGRNFRDVVLEIVEICPGPVSAETVALQADEIVREGRILAKWAPNIVVKVPLMAEGLKAVKQLTSEGIKTNVTLIFSASQALLAAKAGATFVSPFLGRLDDIGQDGMILIRDIVQIFKNYNIQTEVLAASIRHPVHVLQSALAGSHVATMPFKVLQQLVKHPLTDKGIETFLVDWQQVPDAATVFAE
ncbi:MAG TPA: transaldolase [Herpetosiphon sp.]|uniref:Probable transaldolase n=1 Tax=Herpetosiphon aurantiacus (strain ATCC 23779 / DSM 785 / 114-95) TaxID=316274 RepID=TAL_HERA2|nr:fructose-6-phosphate aldolase [Herpetosiphon sp.]A9AZ03.1 RecName: Full=Probable transaldolase [Herpetosiphon aurantiacus DSM 785]ABX07043.1 putative transaldolase [Herpetosiphon aurantiacus DSM 785]MCA0355048.1 fructose-6-phosphate aldolase [Chloroflexota bacterium]HBW52648.1 transaldolase [Herpetosiphon sp.]